MHEVQKKIGSEIITLQSGKLAKQANGAVLGTIGDTSVLSTVCASHEDRPELDYLPLQVEYNEKYYAAGKIPGGFLKREARPKDREILVSRLTDRPLRPLFDKGLRRDIQVVPTVVSSDSVHLPDVLAINCSSAAVVISDIPFNGPVGAVRISYVNGSLLCNPTREELDTSTLDIIIAGTAEGITMVEGGAQEISEELLLEAIEAARAPILELCNLQNSLQEKCGRNKFQIQVPDAVSTNTQVDDIISSVKSDYQTACFVKGKMERADALRQIRKNALQTEGLEEGDIKELGAAFESLESDIVRTAVLQEARRVDGRSPADIRPITTEVGILPRTHGSALFTRGETQSLTVITLGTVQDEKIVDDISGDGRESFLLHYNFPPFSVGETGRLMTGRREIGHGELANRSVRAMIPEKNKFPYTTRIVSEILESNGSSSMATVCAASMALMDAGIPIKKPIAGIAMGLIADGDNCVVLSDISGEEDHLGDMDFKVAGTKDGITGFQMDIKMQNIDAEVMKKALLQAKEGRMHILQEMEKTIAEPKTELSLYAPRIISFKVDPESLGILIGPSGKTIKGMNERFNVSTNIEDDGTVTIYSEIQQNGNNAKAAFLKLLEEPEIGKVYDGTVKRIVDFGAFIEFLPGKEGLCHISKMSTQRIDSVSDVLHMNQSVEVAIIEIDKMGRVNLSLADEEILKKNAQNPPRKRYDNGGRQGGRGHGHSERSDSFSRRRR